METVGKSRDKVGVFVASASQTWVSELAEDSVLAAHEVDGRRHISGVLLVRRWWGRSEASRKVQFPLRLVAGSLLDKPFEDCGVDCCCVLLRCLLLIEV